MFEYLIFSPEEVSTWEDLQNELNAKGAQGWELVTIVTNFTPARHEAHLVFKRFRQAKPLR